MLFLLILTLGTPIEHVSPVNWEGNLARIFSTTITQDGRIFFVNPIEGIVFQTNLRGESLPSIGQKGEGPNEFNWPENIFYDEPFLYVYDGAKDKMFQIDGSTGQFLKSWRVGNINSFSIQGKQIRASFRTLQSGHIFGRGRIIEKVIAFDHYIGGVPCCLRVSGSKKAAVLSARDGTFWLAHTGVFQLEHYSADGKILKKIDAELPDYVAPQNGSQKSRFDTKGRSADIAKFDKIRNLYECGDHIILYRAKRLNDSHLDIFGKNGKRKTTQRVDKIKPIGVLGQTLYGFLRGNDTTNWDIMVVKVYENAEK